MIKTILPYPLEMAFEKVLKNLLLLAKKRYAAKKYIPTKDGYYEDYHLSGLILVRND